jgi:hypothetical protein
VEKQVEKQGDRIGQILTFNLKNYEISHKSLASFSQKVIYIYNFTKNESVGLRFGVLGRFLERNDIWSPCRTKTPE